MYKLSISEFNGLAPSGSTHPRPVLILQYDHVSNVNAEEGCYLRILKGIR